MVRFDQNYNVITMIKTIHLHQLDSVQKLQENQKVVTCLYLTMVIDRKINSFMLDHIEIYDNAIPNEFCNILIELYNKHRDQVQHAPGWLDQIGMCSKNPKLPGMSTPYNWKAESNQLNLLVEPYIEKYKIKYDTFTVLPKKIDQEA